MSSVGSDRCAMRTLVDGTMPLLRMSSLKEVSVIVLVMVR